MILGKNICVVVFSFFLLICLACREEEKEFTPVTIPVEYIYDPIVTKMVAKPPRTTDIIIINSKEEFNQRMPLELINHTFLSKINYDNQSLIYLKFSTPYQFYRIDYSLKQKKDGTMELIQDIHVTNEDINDNNPIFYQVQSNIITKKIPSNSKILLYTSISPT